MARGCPYSFFVALILLVSIGSKTLLTSAENDSRRLYVVYLGDKHHPDPNVVSAFHYDMLSSVLGSTDAASQSIMYTYKHGFSGFSAMLTRFEARKLAGLPNVKHIALSKECKLHTTRSWDFLGISYTNPVQLLKSNCWGEDIIIGVVDTGIWPESESFNDEGYGPIPSRWKGTCQTGIAFGRSNCSRKIIGARWYDKDVDKDFLDYEYKSARDYNGHGTHVASTIAGSLVSNVSYNGLALGAAIGGAPRARLAIYKALWGWPTAYGSDATVLAAIDDAIHDKVDILSLSFSGESAFYTLHGVKAGITVVYSAGNDGPIPQTVEHVAPWVITVAAATIDRAYPTAITLGDNQVLLGHALNYKSPKKKSDLHKLALGEGCSMEDLNGTDISNTIVMCGDGKIFAPSVNDAMSNVEKMGGVGVIYTESSVDSPDASLTPNISVVLVDRLVSERIKTYFYASKFSNQTAFAQISTSETVVGDQVLSRKVASFSSRGPNPILPGILKPDIAAPGVAILAAEQSSYVFKTGTSMAAPHVSAIAALLKSAHPNWSPSAIKSALITTALTTTSYKRPIEAEGFPRKVADPFDFGGGHVNPLAALDPGLIYDIDPNDYDHVVHCQYLQYTALCNDSLSVFSSLNLPSITIPNLKSQATAQRVVTNVGDTESTYKTSIQNPPGVQMQVNPTTLIFNATTRSLSFEVMFSTTDFLNGGYTFGSLTWYNDKHTVRIPIAVRTLLEEYYAELQ